MFDSDTLPSRTSNGCSAVMNDYVAPLSGNCIEFAVVTVFILPLQADRINSALLVMRDLQTQRVTGNTSQMQK